jgi:hypothetical protein
VVLAGFIGTALAAYLVFLGVTHYAHPRLATAMTTHPVTVAADPTTCSRQFDPFGLAEFRSPCDIARRAVAKLGVPYANRAELPGHVAQVEIGAAVVPAFEGVGLDRAVFTQQAKAFDVALAAALADAGYPARAAPELTNVSMLIALMAALSVFVAMASAPLSAWMAEMFPTRIRTTAFAMSYNIGGWFGGFLPAISFAAFTATGDLYAGLWYAAGVLLVALVVGGLFLPETRGRALDRVTLERVP